MSKPSKKLAAFDSLPGTPSEPVSTVTSQPASGRKRARLRTTCEEPPRGKNMSAITTRGLAMRAKLALEHERARDRAAAQQRDAVVVARPVVKTAAGDQRSRRAAGEVDRALGAQVGHELGQFREGEARVADGAAVAHHGEPAVARDAERR